MGPAHEQSAAVTRRDDLVIRLSTSGTLAAAGLLAPTLRYSFPTVRAEVVDGQRAVLLPVPRRSSLAHRRGCRRPATPAVANSEGGDPKRLHLGRGLEFELTSCVT